MDEKKRYHELALRAMHTGRSQFTRFLDPAAERDVLSVANPLGVRVRFFGGYEDAERRIAAFYDAEAPEDWEFPMETLALKWNAINNKQRISVSIYGRYTSDLDRFS